MKLLPFLVILAAGITGLYFTRTSEAGINPILGDESYRARFGTEVPEDINEKERIQIHLAYVEQLLRKKDVSHLSKELQQKRKEAIQLLNKYWKKGDFPSNYDYPGERKPCFRDKHDRICAVGYLVQQTGNEDLVVEIESTENYATIYEMTNSDLINWVEQSGLTLKECAMIQPTYGSQVPSYNQDYIPAEYAISSSAISGLGLTTSLISLNNLNTPQKNGWVVPAVGMASGVSQVTLGVINLNRHNYYDPWTWNYYTNKRSQNLSMFNIAFGTFTTAFNTYAFVQQLRGKKTRTDLSWNVFGYQSPNNEVTVGFNFVKRF